MTQQHLEHVRSRATALPADSVARAIMDTWTGRGECTMADLETLAFELAIRHEWPTVEIQGVLRAGLETLRQSREPPLRVVITEAERDDEEG